MAVYYFDNFELNEDTRSLVLCGQEVAVQPLVFGFLNYLLRHQDRAVSKHELMEALWPHVTVTEASLQRVASLARQTLRRGKAEEALRSVPRFGYRLCLGPPDAPAKLRHPDRRLESSPGAVDLLAEARAAIIAKQWKAAVTSFREADAREPLSAEDLESYALALECTGRPADAIDPLTRSTAAFYTGGKHAGAARSAIALSRIHLERGEVAVASGWHGRAKELVDANQASPEYGLWCWMGSRIAVANDEPEQALALSEKAYQVGKRLDDAVVASLGLIYRGFFRLCLGDIEAGLEDQDLAAAQGLSSDLNPIVGGILYCNILWACRNFGDWGRASEWSTSYIGWCQNAGLSGLTGSCRLHRAEVLGVKGSLEDAEQLVLEAIEQLGDDAPWVMGDAFRVLGDIRFARGDFGAAEDSYQKAHAAGWDPQPGLARLQFEIGEREAAYSGLERSLRGKRWATLQRRGLILATLANLAAQIGRKDRAREIISEIESQPQRWPTPSIKALVSEAKAELLAQDQRHEEAVAEWQSACSFWHIAESPVHEAEARLRLASLLISIGALAAARLEVHTARSLGERLQSRWLDRRLSDVEATAASEHRAQAR